MPLYEVKILGRLNKIFYFNELVTVAAKGVLFGVDKPKIRKKVKCFF